MITPQSKLVNAINLFFMDGLPFTWLGSRPHGSWCNALYPSVDVTENEVAVEAVGKPQRFLQRRSSPVHRVDGEAQTALSRLDPADFADGGYDSGKHGENSTGFVR